MFFTLSAAIPSRRCRGPPLWECIFCENEARRHAVKRTLNQNIKAIRLACAVLAVLDLGARL